MTLELVRKGDVAKAAKVSNRTVENWVNRGTIPFVRFGPRCIRFHMPSVMEALMRHTTEAV